MSAAPANAVPKPSGERNASCSNHFTTTSTAAAIAAIAPTAAPVRRSPRAAPRHRSHLAGGRARAPRANAPWRAPPLPGGRGDPGDVAPDRLGDLGPDALGRPFLGRAADLPDHHHGPGLGVGFERAQAVDE